MNLSGIAQWDSSDSITGNYIPIQRATLEVTAHWLITPCDNNEPLFVFIQFNFSVNIYVYIHIYNLGESFIIDITF